MRVFYSHTKFFYVFFIIFVFLHYEECLPDSSTKTNQSSISSVTTDLTQSNRTPPSYFMPIHHFVLSNDQYVLSRHRSSDTVGNMMINV